MLGRQRAEIGPAQIAGRRAGHMEPAGRRVEHDVGDGRLQPFGGRLPGQLDHVVRRAVGGGATELRGPRPDGAATEWGDGGVAVEHANLFGGHTQLIRHDRRERGLVGLPMRRRAHDHRDRAVRLDGHRRVLTLAAAGDLHGAADADAETHRASASAALLLLMWQLARPT